MAAKKSARVVAVGGGTTSTLWPQIVSDATGADQESPRERMGASFGDAKFAAVAIGAADPDTRWNEAATIVAPAADARPLYDERYRLYHQLREATLPIQHTLAGAASTPE